MKKNRFLLILLVLFLLVSFVSAENIYQDSSLVLKLGVKGGFELVPENGGAEIDSAKVELLLYPLEDYRQKILNWESEGQKGKDKVVFEWKDGTLGKKEYGFTSELETRNKKLRIDRQVAFPLAEVKGLEPYLAASETIDKDHAGIIAKASELAEGEDDLFKVVFKLANWVDMNVDYKLNSLTTGVSQKASWVLENREGVCDEMTSLFIAMCRSLGIPARFVSGISYTTNKEIISSLGTSWAPHGWAEVYFPDYGWVDFDIAFGEYGYIDVTHIKLREGVDPAEASSKFEWLAQKVKLKPENLSFSVEIKGKGEQEEEGVILREELLGKEVGLDSYNLIKGIVENKESYYAVTTLRIAVPKELEVIGEVKKVVLLGPKEEKEVFWLVKAKEDLLSNYLYELPVEIYSEKNNSVKDSFNVVEGGVIYSKEEAEKLITSGESKTYYQAVDLNCDYKKELGLGEEMEITCTIKNRGNMNLKELEFCLGGICKTTDLLINQDQKLKIKAEGKEAGWQKLLAGVKGKEVEKKLSLEYKVLDKPKLVLEIESPEKVDYKENFEIVLKANKSSFSVPKKVSLVLQSGSFENKWELEELKEKEDFILKMNSKGMGKENEFKAKLAWTDDFGGTFKDEKIFIVKVEGKTFWEKAEVWLNGIVNFFG